MVAHFHADWAPQCAQMDDVMKELAADMQYVNVCFVRVGTWHQAGHSFSLVAGYHQCGHFDGDEMDVIMVMVMIRSCFVFVLLSNGCSNI